MVKSLVNSIDSGLGLADFKITLLDALKMAKAAWNTVTPVTIANCFRRGDFISHSESTSEQDEVEEDQDEVEEDREMCHLLLYVCMSHVHLRSMQVSMTP